MQNRILSQINKTCQEVRTVLKENIPPFDADGQSALSAHLSTAKTILNKFQNFHPFSEWMNFLQANTQAIAAVSVLLEPIISDSNVNENLDIDFFDIRKNVTNLFSRAADEIKKSDCPSKVITSMKTFTDNIIRNISSSAKQIKGNAIGDLKERRTMLKKNVDSFNNVIATCINKSNDASRTCILEKVKFLIFT